jgi:hypothetical protein
MDCIDQDASRDAPSSLHEQAVSSGSDSDDDEDIHWPPVSHDSRPGIDIAAIKSAKNVQHTIAHRVEAERSILALVVDDGYLFAGLEGGDITVCISYCRFASGNRARGLALTMVWGRFGR